MFPPPPRPASCHLHLSTHAPQCESQLRADGKGHGHSAEDTGQAPRFASSGETCATAGRHVVEPGINLNNI